MLVRHCVEKLNIDDNGYILDATKIRHVTIRGGKIESLSGPIDRKSHLNFDFRDHKVTTCVIAEKFLVGANIQVSGQGLVFATVVPSSYAHYGFVDYTQRLSDMIKAVKDKKNKNRTQKPRLREATRPKANRRGKS